MSHLCVEGFDHWCDRYWDFTFMPDIPFSLEEGFERTEAFLIYTAIYGFSAGFPECCVLDFLRKVYRQDPHSVRTGQTELTLQYFAACPLHGRPDSEWDR